MASSSIFASKTYIGFVVCLTLFTDMFLYGVIVPVLPYALVDRAGQKQESVQLWNSVLLASFASTMLPMSVLVGWLGDRIESRRWPFIVGQSILGCATIMFAFGRSIPVLAVARMLQGVGSAIAFSVGYALLFDAVGKAKIGHAIGYTGTAMSLGMFFGPLMGGILYDYAGYVWVFVPALIFVGLEIIMRLLVVEPLRSHSASSVGERARLVSSEHSYRQPVESSPEERLDYHNHYDVCGTQADTNTGGTAILILLRDPRFLVAMLSLVIIDSINTSIESILPIFAARRFSFDSTQAALLFLTVTVPLFWSPVVGLVVDRVGTKWPSFIGFALATPAFILLRLIDHSDRTHLIFMVFLLTVIGVAIAIALTSVMTEVSHAVEDLEIRRPGVFGHTGAVSLAFGLQNAALGLGCFIGPLAAGAVMQVSGWPATTLSLGILAAVAAITAVFVTGGSIFHRSSTS